MASKPSLETVTGQQDPEWQLTMRTSTHDPLIWLSHQKGFAQFANIWRVIAHARKNASEGEIGQSVGFARTLHPIVGFFVATTFWLGFSAAMQSDIASAGLGRYPTSMIRYATLLLLVCALLVPRVAWGAHEAGHEQIAGADAVHVHHGDHSHHMDAHNHGHGSADLAIDLDDGKLVHDHVAADVLSAAAHIDDAAKLDGVWHATSIQLLELRSSGAPAAPPSSLLRPPRTA